MIIQHTTIHHHQPPPATTTKDEMGIQISGRRRASFLPQDDLLGVGEEDLARVFGGHLRLLSDLPVLDLKNPDNSAGLNQKIKAIMREPAIAHGFLEQRPQRPSQAHREDRAVLLELQQELAVEAQDFELLHVGEDKVLRLEALLVERDLGPADEDDPLRRADHLRGRLLQRDDAVTHRLALLIVAAQEGLRLLPEPQLLQQVHAPVRLRVVQQVGAGLRLLLELLEADLADEEAGLGEAEALALDLLAAHGAGEDEEGAGLVVRDVGREEDDSELADRARPHSLPGLRVVDLVDDLQPLEGVGRVAEEDDLALPVGQDLRDGLDEGEGWRGGGEVDERGHQANNYNYKS